MLQKSKQTSRRKIKNFRDQRIKQQGNKGIAKDDRIRNLISTNISAGIGDLPCFTTF